MKSNFLPAILAVVAFVPAAHAEKVGNGGGAQVCYSDDAKTVFKSIETYEIWEAAHVDLPKLEIPAWDGKETKADIISRALAKIAAFQPGVAREMRLVLDLMNTPEFVTNASDIDLIPVPDSDLLLTAHDCVYRQMINWLDPGEFSPGSPDRVLRDETYYEKMDPLSQAALDLHEAAFKVKRVHLGVDQYGSRVARQFVSEALSTTAMTTLLIPHDQVDPGIYGAVASTPLYQGFKVAVVAPDLNCKWSDVQVAITYLDGNRPSAVLTAGSSKPEISRGSTLALTGDQVFGGNSPMPGAAIPFAVDPLLEKADGTLSFKIALSGCGLNPIEQTLSVSAENSPWPSYPTAGTDLFELEAMRMPKTNF